MPRVPVVSKFAHKDSGQAEQHRDRKDERYYGNHQIPSTVPHSNILIVEILPRELRDGLLHIQVIVEDGHVLWCSRNAICRGLCRGNVHDTWVVVQAHGYRGFLGLWSGCRGGAAALSWLRGRGGGGGCCGLCDIDWRLS